MTDPTHRGQGPYRRGSLHQDTPKRRRRVALAAAAVVGAGLLYVGLSGKDVDREPPGLADLSLPDARPLGAFPTGGTLLPEAVPLEPLLVADSPDHLALLTPQPGVLRLQRNGALRIQFNRPMVDRAQVGDDLEESPVILTSRAGRIRGTAQWASRSVLVFHAEGRAWDRNLEAALSFDASLRSLDGSSLLDDRERVVVFDGTPHAVSGGVHRVAPGQPLALYFDNPVSAGDLRGDVMAYEIGGGARSLPFALQSRGREENRFRVDVLPRRQLEAGSSIGVALAPRWWTWAGGTPGVMRFMVQPPPQIEGVACTASATSRGQCDHGAAPGRIVDIGGELRIFASEPLAAVAPSQLSIRPPLPGAVIELVGRERMVEIRGPWAADQVYEVRVAGLRTKSGAPLRRFSALAVRSRGRTPSVSLAEAGERLSFERGADPVVHLRGINIRKGALIQRNVEPNELLAAVLHPLRFLRGASHTGAFTPLMQLLPNARPNREDRGEYRWSTESNESRAAVVGLRAGVGTSPVQARFFQQTDLAPSVHVVDDGALIWVTRLSSAEPVAGAEIAIRGAAPDAPTLTGTTDGDGAVFIPTEDSLAGRRFAVSAIHRGDQAALVMEHSRAIGPARLGIYAGGVVRDEELPVASVMTDRGAYRPGTAVHVNAALRQVEGMTASAVQGEEVILRITSPWQSSPIGEESVATSEFGFAHGVFELPASAALGTYTVQVVRQAPEPEEAEESDDASGDFESEEDYGRQRGGRRGGGNGAANAPREEVLGTTSFRVAHFRQPTFVVNVTGPERLVGSDTPAFEVDSAFLFGAPVAGAQVEWSLLRRGAARHAPEYRSYTFAPVDAAATARTEHQGTLQAGDDGVVRFETAAVDVSARERLTLEVEVTDPTGQSTAAHHDFVALPADLEVGLEGGENWVEAGDTLELHAVVLDAEGSPVVGHPVQGRVRREGWHSWWEWQDGSYRTRRDARAERVHQCAFESEEQASGCDFTPDRPGTYVLEVEVADAEGRRALASRRLYVAGPDEAPDRDPPGAPIAVTPRQTEYSVGQSAELAFESPWDDAQALITVHNEGVVHRQQLAVDAGGVTVEVPLTEEMAPNVFVAVTLVRGRQGEPRAAADPASPDLRFGVAEVGVRPVGSELDVRIASPAETEPGQEVLVEATVRTAEGEPAEAEVTLWAVDEGLLRLTDYEAADLASGLFPRQPAVFSWEDLRRALVSRIAPQEWRAGGDGGESEGSRVLRPDEEFPEPVPLWAPGLVTDDEGNVQARFTLPDRATNYRIMAVAMDRGSRTGRVARALQVTSDVVVQDVLPRFVTAGDAFEATFVVHATGAALNDALVVQAGDQERRFEVRLDEGEQARFAMPITAPNGQSLAVTAALGEIEIAREIPIAPRARWRRRMGFGAVQGALGSPTNQPLALRFPELEQGMATLEIASHPFLGLDVLPERMAASPWQLVDGRAARVLALSAAAVLSEGLAARDPSQVVGPLDEAAERLAEGNEAVASLLALQDDEGAFGRWDSQGHASAWESVVGVHALVAARDAGFEVPDEAYDKSIEWLVRTVERRPQESHWVADPQTGLAYALRVLNDAGEPNAAVARELFASRDQLGLAARAHLALAMSEAEKGEQRTLAMEVADFAVHDHTEDDTLVHTVRYPDRRGITLGPVLEAVCSTQGAEEHAGEIVTALLEATNPARPFAWRSSLDAAHAMLAIARYASLFRVTSAGEVTLDGEPLRAASRTPYAARYHLPLSALGGDEHRMEFTPSGEGPLFYSISADWAEPLRAEDRVARGAGAALHRRFETADGRQLQSGDTVRLGEMVRVRLFVYTEQRGEGPTLLHDPMGGGFEAVNAHFATTAGEALRSMLGMDSTDTAMDPRGYHAMRSASSITSRSVERNAAIFGFESLPGGLQEYTYVVRATTPGQFTIPPAQLEASLDEDFVARSAAFELSVAP